MTVKRTGLRLIQLSALLLLLLLLAGPVFAEPQKDLTLGVLAFRPKPEAEARWQPLADHLTAALRDRKVKLEVLNYAELGKALEENRLDFVLTNPGHYVQLRHKNNMSGALATLVESNKGASSEYFGGVIIARRDRTDIRELGQLKGKTIAVVSTGSLGGYQAQALELLHAGVRLARDTRVLITEMPHDLVVTAVLHGKADAGFVRTGVLEEMVHEGRLDLEQLNILAGRKLPAFPYVLSTPLYPEWPFIALPHINDNISRQVAAALLSLEHGGVVARRLGLHGFTIPADYSVVENMLLELRLPPFDKSPDFTLQDVWRRYRIAINVLGISLLIIGGLTLGLVVSNRRLVTAREAARENENKYQLLAENTADVFWQFDLREQRFTYVSPSVLRLRGYTAGEVMTQTMEVCLTPASLTTVQERLAETLAEFARGRTDPHVSLQEVEQPRKDGSTVWTEVSTTYILDKDGQPVAINGISRDITERKRNQKQIERLSQEREELIEDLQKSLAEIKTLQGILPICSYCKKIRDDEGAWMQIESYISKRTDAEFSHGICSDCAKKAFPEFF